MKTLVKKETIKKIEEEINQKSTLPKEFKEKIRKYVFTNIILAIAIIIYFTFLIAGSFGTEKAVRTIDFNIFSMVLLGVSIYLFEIAYKKENGVLAIHGIEILIVSIVTLFFPYIIFELEESYKKNYMIVSGYIGVYYIIKSICIAKKIKKTYIKQSSDIKEIVKKEKRKDVIRVKEKKIEEPSYSDSQEKKTKKPEKSENNIVKEIKDELKPKKRGRPKKTEQKEKENSIKTQENKKEQPKKNAKTVEKNEVQEKIVKKRGRPRKVVKDND